MEPPAPDFRFASQDEVHAQLVAGLLAHRGTLLCLRRRPPDWWPQASLLRPEMVLRHIPVPPSLDPACEAVMREVLAALPLLAGPVTVFCKEGRNRSGMLAAAVACASGAPMDQAIAIYTARAGEKARTREVEIIRRLAPLAAGLGWPGS